MEPLKNDFTPAAVLAKILMNAFPGYYDETNIEKFTPYLGWNNGAKHCHTKTAEFLREHPRDDLFIVLTGTNVAGKPVVSHSFVTNRSGRVLSDTFAGKYDKRGHKYVLPNGSAHKILVEYPTRKLDMPRRSHTQTAKLERAISDAFLKTLYALMIYSIDTKLDAKLKKLATDNRVVADKFLRRFAMQGAAYKKLFNAATLGKKFSSVDEENLVQLGYDIKDIYPELVKETDIDQDRLKMLKAFYIWFIKGNDPNFYKLEKSIGVLNDPTLSSYFTDDEVIETGKNSQKDTNAKLKALIKKNLGITATRLTVDQGKALKEKDPQAYKQYNFLRRRITEVYKDFVKTLVRKSGQKYLPYDEVLSALAKNGVEHTMPIGFKGYIDADLNWYTTAGKLINGKPSNVDVVVMNPRYDAEQDNFYVFTGGAQRYYTTEYNKSAKVERFQKVSKLETVINQLQKKWQADILTKNGQPQQILATVVDLIHKFAARTGNKNNKTKGTPTFGATTLLVKHVKVQGTGLIIDYSGKKESEQIHKLLPKDRVSKKEIELIKSLMEGKQPTDPLWTYDGEQIPTIAFSRYFKRLGSGGATLHNLRHMEGTKAARNILSKAPFKKGSATQAEVERWYKEAMKKVGEILVHVNGEKVTGLTAIKSYIDPVMQGEFFTSLGLRVPSFLKIKE